MTWGEKLDVWPSNVVQGREQPETGQVEGTEAQSAILRNTDSCRHAVSWAMTTDVSVFEVAA